MCHPLTLFVFIIIIILLLSLILGALEVSVINPVNQQEVKVINLLNGAGLARMLADFAKNVNNFPPFVLVMTIMFGVGLAESTGFAETLMKVSVLKAPAKLIVPILLFLGINSNVTGDAGFVLMPIVCSMVFMALGKHPIAGMALGYAAVAGGFSANIMIGTTDLLIIGFTQPAAEMIDPNYMTNPAMNFYFIAASAIFLVPVGAFINYKFVEPRLGKYLGEIEEMKPITAEQKRGLRWAGVSFLASLVLFLLLIIPKGAPLRSPQDGQILSMTAPFMSGIVPIITIAFFVPSVFYGFGCGILKNDKDVCTHIGKAMAGMGGYVAFCIVAAQMIAYFSWSNLGPVTAISGANFLSKINLTGIPLFILFIILASLINLLISSNSAKWAILAPVFIPMFMLLGYDPALTQVAYRIGDSVTNAITPMMAYFALLVGLAQKYDKNAGMGSLMSALLPYSVGFLISWTIFFIIWFLLGLPIGPGYGIYLK
jgi:aminobenzoyl-glutamate transport protein